VRGVRGRIVAAVNVSAPRFRFAGRIEEAGAATRLAADRLSARLGAPADGLSRRRRSAAP
jgi:DNA-binding IclR family transcriptional regulator